LVLIIALGLVGGNFYNFLSFSGYYGHLYALICFIIGLSTILSLGANNKLKQKVLSLFFPILFLFTGYQAPFVIFFSLLVFVSFLQGLFIKSFEKQLFFVRLKYIIKDNILPLIIPLAIALIILPQLTYQAIKRMIQAATQIGMKPEGLIDPFIFSGASFVNESLYLSNSVATPLSYLFFLLPIIFLAIIIFFNKDQNVIPATVNINLKCITILFIICITLYLISFNIFGDTYQVFKFAGYSVLPISFIPIVLVFLSLRFILNQKKSIFNITSIISIVLIFLVPIIQITRPYYPEIRHNKFFSPLPLIYELSNKLTDDKDKSRIIFDFTNEGKNLTAAILTENFNGKIDFLQGVYFLPSLSDFLSAFDENAVIYTDKLYTDLYGGDAVIDNERFFLNRYDYSDLLRIGAVSYDGIYPFTHDVTKDTVKLKILVPFSLRSNSIELNISFSLISGNDQLCNRSIAKISDNNDEYQNFDIKSIKLNVAENLAAEGILEAEVHFPGFVFIPEYNNITNKGVNTLLCDYKLQKVRLNPIS
jgi:hypothetical protein